MDKSAVSGGATEGSWQAERERALEDILEAHRKDVQLSRGLCPHALARKRNFWARGEDDPRLAGYYARGGILKAQEGKHTQSSGKRHFPPDV